MDSVSWIGVPGPVPTIPNVGEADAAWNSQERSVDPTLPLWGVAIRCVVTGAYSVARRMGSLVYPKLSIATFKRVISTLQRLELG